MKTGLPQGARGKPGKWNIIAGERAAAGKTLAAHISDWRLALEAKGNSIRHVRNFLANMNHLAADCGWKHLTDIVAADPVRWIAARKAAGRSAATINHHIRASKAFCGWLAKEKRIAENPLAHVSLLNEKADRRIERHPYSVEELGLFHGLRHTFATLLNKARVPLATAQRLMRHSDPKLTAGIYTHVLVADKADELTKLPEIAATATAQEEAAAMTGTTGAEAAEPPFLGTGKGTVSPRTRTDK